MKKTRQANYEVLRIIAMFMILMLHANFLSFNIPESYPKDMTSQSILILRTLCETLSLVAVNVFIMISGYWGIKFSFRKLFSFSFQIVFWGLLVTLSVIVYEGGVFDSEAIINILMLNNGYWFVKSYLLLFIMAPILRTFTKNITEKEYRVFIVLFFSFQFIFGWLYSGVSWFHSGYSTISFVGLYLLAGYIRQYRTINLEKRYYLGLFILTSAISAFAVLYVVYNGGNANLYLSYNSPLIIMGTIMLFLFFEKLEVKPRKYIFFLSSSCFAVYLMHCNEYSIEYYCDTVRYLESICSGTGGVFLFLLILLLFMSLVYIAAVLIDKVRMYLFKRIEKMIITYFCPDSTE